MSGGAPLPSSFDDNTEFYEENRFEKFTRRLKEEPLIPLGCALTCYALYGATKSMRKGDHHLTNRMFRSRIYAQGFTLLCIVAGGAYYKEDREKRKEFDSTVAERKAKEKNEAWIRELEARDREEKEEQAKKAEARRLRDEMRNGGQGQASSIVRSVIEDMERRSRISVVEAVQELLRR